MNPPTNLRQFSLQLLFKLLTISAFLFAMLTGSFGRIVQSLSSVPVAILIMLLFHGLAVAVFMIPIAFRRLGVGNMAEFLFGTRNDKSATHSISPTPGASGQTRGRDSVGAETDF